MRAGNVDYAYHSVLVHDSHFRPYAVGRAFVESYVVVDPVGAVVDHAGEDETVALQRRVGGHRVGVDQFACPFKLLLQIQHLAFEHCVASLQVLVDVAQMEVGGQIAGALVYDSRHRIGRRQHHMVLPRIAVKQQEAPRHHIDGEEHP